jgi:Spy/CpxP family protein refolding chaperone
MMVATVGRAPWQNPRILSTLALVFLAGAASGALWMQLGLHEKLHHTVAAATREPTRDAVLQQFRSQLDLSSTQSDKIALVLDDYREYYQSLQDQLDDLRSTGKSRIMQILNPDQRDKFEKMMSQLAPQLESSPRK